MGSSTIYTPLEKSCRQIRLLKQISAPGQTAIVCLLETFEIQSAPSYAALSYEWGSSDTQGEIYINGNSFSVRQNLWNFFNHRGCTGYDWIWIDAMCINQDDTTERSHQVSIMADIYRQARLVVVWLGLSSQHMDDAFTLFAQFDTLCLKEHAESISAPDRLCDNSYWTRLWVLQELTLAQDLLVCVGGNSMTWTEVFLFIELHDRPISQSPASLMSQRVRRVRAGIDIFTGILEVSHRLHCVEPLDRVYALLGICEMGTDVIYTDYSVDLVCLAEDLLQRSTLDPVKCHEFMNGAHMLSEALGIQDSRLFQIGIGSKWHDRQDGCTQMNIPCGALFWGAFATGRHRICAKCLKDPRTRGELLAEASTDADAYETVSNLVRSFTQDHDVWSRSSYLLHRAIWCDNITTILISLEHPDVDVNCSLETGETLRDPPLVHAIRKRRSAIVGMLLQRLDLDVNSNCTGDTALSLAAKLGTSDIVRQLLQRPDIDVNAGDDWGFSALIVAMRHEHSDIVHQLLQRPELNVNATNDEGDTALTLAVPFGDRKLFHRLLAREDLNINSQGAYGKTALVTAIIVGKEDVVDQLLQRSDIDINAETGEGMSALVLAIEYRHSDIALQLLQRPKIDIEGALMAALKAGYQDIAARLLQRQDVDTEGVLITALRAGYQDIASQLLQRRDVNSDLTDLMYLVEIGLEKRADELLQRPDPDVEDTLIMAARSRHEEIINQMFQRPDLSDMELANTVRENPEYSSTIVQLAYEGYILRNK